MTMLTKKRVIYAGIETTYGTDPLPTGTGAVLTRNLEITPFDATIVSRDTARTYLGNFDQLVADKKVQVTFEVEMQASGTLGTVPAYGILLRACGFAETIAAGVSVTYAPISAAFESATIYFNVDGTLHKVTGCRGNLEMMMDAKAIPVFKFTFTGLYNAPSDVAQASPTGFASYKTPLVVNNQNTTGFSFFGYSGAMEKLSINMASQIEYRMLVGAENVLITDRKPSGTISFEAPTITAKDFFTAANAATLGALAITHGTVAGYKVAVNAARCNVTKPAYKDSQGVQMLELPFVLEPSTAGNDEISIVFT